MDSDDWVDPRAYLKILETLQDLESEGQEVDAFVLILSMKREGQSRKKSMSYESVLPVQQIFGWDQVGNFSKGQYIMMHSLITGQICCERVSSNCLSIPFMSIISSSLPPLQQVKTMYYLPVDFYRI